MVLDEPHFSFWCFTQVHCLRVFLFNDTTLIEHSILAFPPCPAVFQYRKTVADAVKKRLSSDLGHSDPPHTPKQSPKRNIASPLTRSATRRIANGNKFQPETTGNPHQSSTSVPQKLEFPSAFKAQPAHRC